VSRALSAVNNSQQILRDELLFAFLSPSQRNALTFEAYAKTNSYTPGGEAFGAGLFPWESALLDDPRVPRSGRVLLGAAGGGRELKALQDRGYQVCAFEPVSRLAESAREVARGAGTVVTDASYQDLVTRAAGQRGPLDSLRGPFELCILGWGSLSHLTEPDDVLALFRALKVLAPSAPVVASFIMRSSGPEPTAGGARKLRRLLRQGLAVAGGPVPPGLEFYTEAGFIYAFSRDEMLALCQEARYEVAHFSQSDYPHVLLLPKPA
jgi:hypothetical protein